MHYLCSPYPVAQTISIFCTSSYIFVHFFMWLDRHCGNCYLLVNMVHLWSSWNTFNEVFVFLVDSVGHPEMARRSRLDVKHHLKKKKKKKKKLFFSTSAEHSLRNGHDHFWPHQEGSHTHMLQGKSCWLKN